MNLILAQYWTMKEYLLVLASSEVTILLAVASFLASCSLGYLLSPRQIGRAVSWACLLLFVIQLFFPWLLKELAAVMYQRELPHITLALLGFGILVMAPLYTILLPYLIRMQEETTGASRGAAVSICYGLELAGALLGVLIVLTVGRLSHASLLVIYFLNFSFILAFVYGTRTVLYAAIPVSLCYGLLYGPLERAATVDFYQSRESDEPIRLLGVAQSLYNRIDVLQNQQGEKFLLLNGREYFNPSDLEAFNRYLTGVPSSLMPGSRVLIVGTGSLSSVYHASRSAATVESVEIDAQVVGLTKELFREYNHLETIKNWRLHIDDAKHFLGSTEARYDLIAVDMVPPVYVQTALLFSREFYELAKQRLTPRGVLSIYTGDWFGKAETSPFAYNPVKTIDAVFPEYLVVNSQAAGMAFAYASPHMPFGKQDVLTLLEASGSSGQDQVFEPQEARPLIAHHRVSSLEDLRIVLEWAPSGYRDLVSVFGVWP
jgi:spermidine synthase